MACAVGRVEEVKNERGVGSSRGPTDDERRRGTGPTTSPRAHAGPLRGRCGRVGGRRGFRQDDAAPAGARGQCRQSARYRRLADLWPGRRASDAPGAAARGRRGPRHRTRRLRTDARRAVRRAGGERSGTDLHRPRRHAPRAGRLAGRPAVARNCSRSRRRTRISSSRRASRCPASHAGVCTDRSSRSPSTTCDSRATSSRASGDRARATRRSTSAAGRLSSASR